MLRIHFTPEDIGRVRLAADLNPVWETMLSVFRMRRQGPDLVFRRWREKAIRTVRRDDLDILLPLVRNAYYPDFLTPAEGIDGLPAALDAIRSTPVARLREEMTELARIGNGPTPPWLRLLAEGDRPTLDRLTGAIRSYHDAAVAPFASDLRVHLDADRARRTRILLEQGVEGLLRSFPPMMHWQPPVLEINVPQEQDLHLEGRGLLLVPAYLSWGTPDFLKDTRLPPVLVYPVDHGLALAADAGHSSIAELIGPTRSSVLESIGSGRTTSELARRVGVSAASVSQHTAVLREARLIHTTRLGKAVLHTMTPLGEALLEGKPS